MLGNKAIAGTVSTATSTSGTRTEQQGICAFEFDGCQGFGGNATVNNTTTGYGASPDKNVRWNTALFQPGSPDDLNTGGAGAANAIGLTGVWTKVGDV